MRHIRYSIPKWLKWQTFLFVSLSLLAGIGGFVAAFRALYLLAAVREFEYTRINKGQRSIISYCLLSELNAMDYELLEAERHTQSRNTFGEFKAQESRSNLESVLNRRRTGSMAWAIWSAVQFALIGMVLGIISVAIGIGR